MAQMRARKTTSIDLSWPFCDNISWAFDNAFRSRSKSRAASAVVCGDSSAGACRRRRSSRSAWIALCCVALASGAAWTSPSGCPSYSSVALAASLASSEDSELSSSSFRAACESSPVASAASLAARGILVYQCVNINHFVDESEHSDAPGGPGSCTRASVPLCLIPSSLLPTQFLLACFPVSLPPAAPSEPFDRPSLCCVR
jgi:hypothetical protein